MTSPGNPLHGPLPTRVILDGPDILFEVTVPVRIYREHVEKDLGRALSGTEWEALAEYLATPYTPDTDGIFDDVRVEVKRFRETLVKE